ncbi:MAG: superoxide dismutase [Candidatus Gracilibacteria bacterium]|nr:superoxide dismutase [Candidatus Gracilibacteria bacterium]
MFQLPQLPYAYDALEPHIDAKTMEIHHDKHHQAYLDKFNATLEKYPELQNMKAHEILKDLAKLEVEEADRKSLRNNGGGYVNHSIFWKLMGPAKEIDEALVKEIKETFGSIENFKNEFTQAASTHFGSGWAWLVRDENKKLKVYSLPNQDSPYTLGHEPILTLDLWEHAYYLNYQNRRPDYITAWWNVLKMI